jgi:lambda family phage portal protein
MIKKKKVKKKQLKKRYFEAASRRPPAQGTWDLINSRSQYIEKESLRNRSRNLYVNNPYAKRGINTLTYHAVGKGIIPQVKNLKIEKLFKDWIKSRTSDLNNRRNFYGIQSFVLKTVIMSGESLVRKIITKGASPLKIQVLEPDLIDESKGDNGLVYDKYGAIDAYWIYEQHPQDKKFNGVSNKVSSKDICHVFNENRAGESRGIPWLASVMLRIKDYGEYEHAQLTRIKNATCFVGIISDIDGGDDFSKEEEDLKTIEPGTFKFAPANKNITFNTPPVVDQGSYPKDTLLGIATGLEVPYFLLSGDYSQINYSSARMAMNEFYKHIDFIRSHIIIPQLCERVFEWFLEALLLKGIEADVECTWTPPARATVDATKEVEGYKNAIRAGLLSQSQAIKEYSGLDPEDLLQEMKNDNAILDRLGLVLDTTVTGENRK